MFTIIVGCVFFAIIFTFSFCCLCYKIAIIAQKKQMAELWKKVEELQEQLKTKQS